MVLTNERLGLTNERGEARLSNERRRHRTPSTTTTTTSTEETKAKLPALEEKVMVIFTHQTHLHILTDKDSRVADLLMICSSQADI